MLISKAASVLFSLLVRYFYYKVILFSLLDGDLYNVALSFLGTTDAFLKGDFNIKQLERFPLLSSNEQRTTTVRGRIGRTESPHVHTRDSIA